MQSELLSAKKELRDEIFVPQLFCYACLPALYGAVVSPSPAVLTLSITASFRTAYLYSPSL